METLQAGEKFPIAQNAGVASISVDGTLIYGDFFSAEQLVWLDREGKKLDEIGLPQDDIRHPALSPDERQVAVTGEEDGNFDIWIHEVDRPAKDRLTSSDNTDLLPNWLPSGEQITFSSGPKQGTTKPGTERALFIRRADASGAAEPLLAGATDGGWITDWSSDGRFALSVRMGKGFYDLWYLKRKDDDSGYEAVPFLESEFVESGGQFSPDDHWVVYGSNDSRRGEVYIRSFPDGTGRTRVSLNGGGQARWSRDGRTIFYVEGASLMAQSVTTEPGFSIIGAPRKLFESRGLPPKASGDLNYDVSADGQRFVVIELVETKAEDIKAHVVQNWYEEFRDREQD